MKRQKKQTLKVVTVPIEVLRCSKLTLGARLLYGEIAAICQRDGYCMEQNDYFAKLYKVSSASISLWINSLRKNRFIQCQIKHRYIRIIFLQGVGKKQIKQMVAGLTGAVNRLADNTTYYRHEHSGDVRALEDDFDVETKEWIDDKGHKRGRDSIDYEGQV